MNIELSNGLDHLYQWDAGQKVKIPENVPTVHFKWGNVAVPFDVVDGWVEIPPELTQKAGYILLWTYREDHTLDAARIPVERRPKPYGYAYTPTEIKTWESLDARIKALEAANVQPNWDQNDDSAADYVRGRTHYVGSKHDVRIINQYEGHFEPELGLVIGNSYRVWYDTGNGFGGDTAAKEFVCQTLIAGDGGVPNPYVGKPYVGNADTDGGPKPYLIFDNYILLHTGFSHAANPIRWKIEGDFAAVKTLDLKYLDPKLLERIKALEDGGGVAGVSSVNGQTGAVTITASGIGAATPSDVNTAVNSAWSEAQQTLGPLFDAKQPKGDYITQDGLQDATNAALAQAKASGEFDGAGLDVTGATVGQTVKISAVDVNGVPTAWEPVDMPTGGGECGCDEDFELIIDDTVPANAAGYTNDKDINGESFALREWVLILWTPAHTDNDHGNVGRGAGFIPASKWGVNVFKVTDTVKKSDGIGRYDMLHIKVVSGYQMQLLHTRSQNTSNSFGVMQQDVAAGIAPINFKMDATALFEPDNATGYATCVKIAGYVNECVPAGTRIKLYGKRVKS